MQHLAIIPDGNRRWAAKNKLASLFGHRQGMESVRSTIKVCIKNSIKYLSIYTFSLENFRRSEAEKKYLFNLLKDGFSREVPSLIENDVKVKFIGDINLFPEDIQDVVAEIQEKTQHCKTLQLNLLFCYGGQQEIAYAAKQLARKVQNGELDADEITEDLLKEHLWTVGIPDPDLIIRTSNVIRLSNFLLFQAAYSEFLFLDCYWPEVTEELLQKALQRFLNVKRNFGT